MYDDDNGELLDEVTLSAAAADIKLGYGRAFQNNFRNLFLECFLRDAGTGDNGEAYAGIECNDDISTVYNSQRYRAYQSGEDASSIIAGTRWHYFLASSNNAAAAGRFGYSLVSIADFGRTDGFKYAQSQHTPAGIVGHSTVATGVWLMTGAYLSLRPITRIRLVPQSGLNFQVGSSARIYGVS